jgi:branched-chain amino acid transport system substrate-binding protein
LFAIAVFAANVVRADDPPELLIGMAGIKTTTQARNAREQQQGLQLWIDEINARGGLAGYKVKLRYRDEPADAETLAATYEKLITDDRVALLIGPNAADIAAVAATVAERHEMQLIVPTTTNNAFWEHGYKNIVGLSTAPDFYFDALLQFSQRKGLRRVALVYPESGFARDVVEGVKARLTALGMYAIAEVSYNAGQSDFAPVVEKLKRRYPDVLIVGAFLPDALAFMKEAKAQKTSARVVAFSGGAELGEFGQQLGTDAEAVFGVSQWEASLTMAGAADFARRYKTKYGYDPDAFAAGGYAAGQVWEAAIKKVGLSDRARLRKALFDLDTTTVLGRYKVDGRGRQIGKNAYTVQWNRGARAVVLTPETAAAPVLFPFRDWSKR